MAGTFDPNQAQNLVEVPRNFRLRFHHFPAMFLCQLKTRTFSPHSACPPVLQIEKLCILLIMPAVRATDDRSVLRLTGSR